MAFQIPVTGEHAIDGAAMYLCILSYPDGERKRRETFEACVAYRVRSYRERHKHVGIDDAFAARTRPLLERWPSRDMWGALEVLNKQLLNRRKAAELLGYDAVSDVVKPPRRVAGSYPQRFVSGRGLRMKADGSLGAVNEMRLEPDFPIPKWQEVVEEESGVQHLRLIDPSCVRAATNSDVLRIGAKRWHMTAHSVGAVILRPARLVPHMALALRESLIRRPADLLDLLTCSRWVLPCIEDSKQIAGTWADNANVYPAWRKFDPNSFVELRADV